MKWKLNWKGDQVVELTKEQLEKVMVDIGLAAEGNAKRELRKGHGVLTGTLRRSIHAAEPGYQWSADTGASKMGGKTVTPEHRGGKLVVELGSGLQYAMAIHQGWSGGRMRGSFPGYHYITNGVERTRSQVPMIVTKHKLK